MLPARAHMAEGDKGAAVAGVMRRGLDTDTWPRGGGGGGSDGCVYAHAASSLC